MRLNIERTAGIGAVWDPRAFDEAIGKPLPMTYNGRHIATGYLRAVRFTHNYRKAILSIEVAGE